MKKHKITFNVAYSGEVIQCSGYPISFDVLPEEVFILHKDLGEEYVLKERGTHGRERNWRVSHYETGRAVSFAYQDIWTAIDEAGHNVYRHLADFSTIVASAPVLNKPK